MENLVFAPNLLGDIIIFDNNVGGRHSGDFVLISWVGCVILMCMKIRSLGVL